MSTYSQQETIIVDSASIINHKLNPITFVKDKLVSYQSTENRLIYRRQDGSIYTQILGKRTTEAARKTITK